MELFNRIRIEIKIKKQEKPLIRGKYLTRMAKLYGVKRRFLESDSKLRDRVLRELDNLR